MGLISSKTPNPIMLMSFKPPQPKSKLIPMKLMVFLHGEPRVIWKKDEVNQMIINEKLQFAIISKFSYG